MHGRSEGLIIITTFSGDTQMMKDITTAETGRMLPVIDAAKCNRCNTCVDVCPRNAIHEPPDTTCAKCIKYCFSMEVPCMPEHLAFAYELCIGCGLCVAACPQRAIAWHHGDEVARDI